MDNRCSVTGGVVFQVWNWPLTSLYCQG